MDPLSNTEILEGLKNQDQGVINYLYKRSFPVIERYILRNHGCHEDARDIFHEALIVIYRKVITGGLNLDCMFTTFLYAVCEKMWLKYLRDYKEISVDSYVLDEYSKDFYINAEKELRKHDLFEYHFNRLSKACQKILKLHFSGSSIAEIMAEMGYNSKQHTMDRKYRCKKSLYKRIRNDPRFNELTDEIF